MEPNFQPFKEPRGFIRLLQWLFAICAFATCVDYSGKFTFDVQCQLPNATAGFKYSGVGKIEYPFDLDQEFVFYPDPPNDSCKQPEIGLIGNAKSEAVFFVFTGVVSFLYATVMIAVYLLADRQYLDYDKAPLLDFLVTVMLAVFWIAGASAWAHGVSTLSTAIDVKEWLPQEQVCKTYLCSNFSYSSVSKLVISVLFGFINFVLWSGNIWFLYKETAVVLNGVRFGGGSQAPQISSGGSA
ncbi:unnamed protein product [Orchesella dallaii]|uniref:MARVEL domain-containing protein n=1 Tax=Orchesella dallaii TaxID=48710 RepID=A0ABP1PS95_9HEXA